MAKKQTQHTRLKRTAAGPKGTTEKKQAGGTRLDAYRNGTATEIERSNRIGPALNRLRKEQAAKKVLHVNQNNMDRAVELALEKQMKVTIKNLGGTKRRQVKP